MIPYGPKSKKKAPHSKPEKQIQRVDQQINQQEAHYIKRAFAPEEEPEGQVDHFALRIEYLQYKAQCMKEKMQQNIQICDPHAFTSFSNGETDACKNKDQIYTILQFNSHLRLEVLDQFKNLKSVFAHECTLHGTNAKNIDFYLSKSGQVKDTKINSCRLLYSATLPSIAKMTQREQEDPNLKMNLQIASSFINKMDSRVRIQDKMDIILYCKTDSLDYIKGIKNMTLSDEEITYLFKTERQKERKCLFISLLLYPKKKIAQYISELQKDIEEQTDQLLQWFQLMLKACE